MSKLLGLQTEANWRVLCSCLLCHVWGGGGGGGSSQTVVQSSSSLSPALRSIFSLYILLILANTRIKIHHGTGQCYLMRRGLLIMHVEVQETAKFSDQGNASGWGGRRDILSGVVMVLSILWLCGRPLWMYESCREWQDRTDAAASFWIWLVEAFWFPHAKKQERTKGDRQYNKMQTLLNSVGTCAKMRRTYGSFLAHFNFIYIFLFKYDVLKVEDLLPRYTQGARNPSSEQSVFLVRSVGT